MQPNCLVKLTYGWNHFSRLTELNLQSPTYFWAVWMSLSVFVHSSKSANQPTSQSASQLVKCTHTHNYTYTHVQKKKTKKTRQQQQNTSEQTVGALCGWVCVLFSFFGILSLLLSRTFSAFILSQTLTPFPMNILRVQLFVWISCWLKVYFSSSATVCIAKCPKITTKSFCSHGGQTEGYSGSEKKY